MTTLKIRSQNETDKEREEISFASGVDTRKEWVPDATDPITGKVTRDGYWKDLPDLTRQEDYKETTIEHIFAHGLFPKRQPMYLDESILPQDMYEAQTGIRQIKELHSSLDNTMLAKYPTWPELMQAIDRGEVVLAPEEAPSSETPKATSSTSDEPPKTPPSPAPAVTS